MKRAIYFIYREIARDRAKSQVDLQMRDDPRFRADTDRGNRIYKSDRVEERRGEGRRETGEVKGERQGEVRRETGEGRSNRNRRDRPLCLSEDTMRGRDYYSKRRYVTDGQFDCKKYEYATRYRY